MFAFFERRAVFFGDFLAIDGVQGNYLPKKVIRTVGLLLE